MKEVFAPHLNRHVKLGGRRMPLADCPHLHLKNYLSPSIAAPPSATNYRAKAMPSLRRMYMNDSLGCCTISAKAHLKGLVTGNADGGSPVLFPDSQIVSWYQTITGYKPNDPSTDRGADMQSVLNWFVKNGYGAGTQKPVGYVAVDLSNKAQVAQAVYLFEGTDAGLSLPDSSISPFPSKDGEWNFSGSPDSENGHDPPIVDYDANGVYLATWALIMHVKWADFCRIGSGANGGEGYILCDPDMIAKASGKAANGLGITELLTDFDKIYGGNVPIPAPAPSPTPVPVPVPVPPTGVTLAQAEAWATAPFASGPWLLSRDTAEKQVKAGLAGNWPK